MSSVFWVLAVTTVIFGGALLFRVITSYVDEVKDSHVEPDLDSFGDYVDQYLLRWTAFFLCLTTGWGVVELLVRLLH